MASSPARILVAGSGAIGSVFGGFLRNAGHDVTLFGRDWHLDPIHSHGLKIEGLWGSHRAAGFRLATQVQDLEWPYDLILISVKAYDTSSMVEAVSPYLREEGLAVSLQNGLGNVETLAAKFSAERSLGSSILVGAKIPEAGSVTITVQAAPIVIGPLAPTVGAMARCRLWISALKDAGIPCEATNEILPHLWAKVFYNAPLNPLGALLQIHYGALGEEPELRAIMNGIITEAFEVARRKKVRLLWPSVNAYLDLFYGKLVPATYDHQTSMWQDLERGRRTEINALNGQVWKYGRELEFETPFNETATRLIWAREKNRTSEKAASQWFSSYVKDTLGGRNQRVMTRISETLLAEPAWQEIIRHAGEAFSEECCGVILFNGRTDVVRRCTNRQNELHALDPITYPRDATTAYAMDPIELERILEEAERSGDTIKAFYHSHPNHEAYFSAEDKAFASPFGEPVYPDCVQIVISIFDRTVRELRAYAWAEEKKDFVEVPLRKI